MQIKFYPHQQKELEETKDLNKVAYFHDMRFAVKLLHGAEKLIDLGAKVNLVICQKSKIKDWIEHFHNYYGIHTNCNKIITLHNLTSKSGLFSFKTQLEIGTFKNVMFIGFINYELAFRRPELLNLHDFTLMLDESSLIQNETAKRTKFIMKLNYKNLILLSGTPVSGKYENLWSQLHMLGWNISKDLFWRQYVDFYYDDRQGFPIKIVKGYKNVDRLKNKLREYRL